MAEEIKKMWENKIYEIIKTKEVRPGYSILMLVWYGPTGVIPPLMVIYIDTGHAYTQTVVLKILA